jgi:hypothetical protein
VVHCTCGTSSRTSQPKLAQAKETFDLWSAASPWNGQVEVDPLVVGAEPWCGLEEHAETVGVGWRKIDAVPARRGRRPGDGRPEGGQERRVLGLNVHSAKGDRGVAHGPRLASGAETPDLDGAIATECPKRALLPLTALVPRVGCASRCPS